jgi:chromosome segregation ATPase
MTRFWPRTALLHLPALALLAGCTAVNTYVSERGDLSSGRTEQAVNAAQARQDEARQTNAALTQQVAELQAERDRLASDMARNAARLHDIDASLRRTRTATDAQKAQFLRLQKQQQSLQKQLDDAAREAQPASAGDAASQSLNLQRLRVEKEDLERQINVLRETL